MGALRTSGRRARRAFDFVLDYRGWFIGLAVVLGILTFIWFFVVGYWVDVTSMFWKWLGQNWFERQHFPNGWDLLGATPLFYIWAMIIFAVFAWGIWTASNEAISHKTEAIMRGGAITLVVLAVLSAIYTFTGFWNNDKDEARSYADATVFAVENIDAMPQSLSSLADGATKSVDCELLGKHDVHGCIVRGDLPADWEQRSTSFKGAEIVMKRTSGGNPNTELLSDTLTYLYDEDGKGSWTAIRNGINRQPVQEVVSYDGQKLSSCKFKGDFKLNYAFGGNWGQNLSDEIAENFGNLFYEDSDMWGFCRKVEASDTLEPVIVIPVTEQIGYERRTTMRAAGVLEITGSSSGEPVYRHVKQVKAGDYPGPVYSLSLVGKQREMVQWASGRKNKNTFNFGFEATSVETQAGNDSDYLLRSKEDRRTYWVTPLKPRGTDSQLLVAYSVTPADEVKSGSLNRQTVYVLPDEDSRIVNLDDLEARVSQAIRDANPGFYSGDNPGRLVEFLPVSEDTWQVYAELGGRVVYRITVPTDARVRPTVAALDSSVDGAETEQPSGSQPPDEGDTSPSINCGKPVAELTNAELASCLAQLADENARRQNTAPEPPK